MRAMTDEQDFTTLAEQYRDLVQALVDSVNMPPIGLDVEPTPGGNFRGFDAGHFYVVKRGTISACYQSKTIYRLEEGDILVVYGSDAAIDRVRYL